MVFDYRGSPSRTPPDFLGDWRGHLMVDDFSGYKALFANGVTELGCLAHARRKYFDLNAAEPNAIAREALERIKALYAIEDCGRELDIEGRTQLRQEQNQPLLASMPRLAPPEPPDGGQRRRHRQGHRLQPQSAGRR